MSVKRTKRLGIDVGGTYTDFGVAGYSHGENGHPKSAFDSA